MIKLISDIHDVEDIKKEFVSGEVPMGSTVPNLVILLEEGNKYRDEVLTDRDAEILLSSDYGIVSTRYCGLNPIGFKTASKILAENRNSSYRGIVDKLNAELLETKPF